MTKLFPFPRPYGLLLLTLGSGAGGAALDCHFRNATWARREQDYQRQLSGELTEREKQIEALNTRLGLTSSRLVSQSTLEQQYQAQLTQKDADFEKFRQQHALRVQSLSNSLFELQEQVHKGTTRVQEEAALEPESGEATPSSNRHVISYEYVDADDRVHLKDPDIWIQGDESLELTQHFQVRGTVLRQADGSLMTQRVQLIEVAPAEGGTYRELARAELKDASFIYSNPPHPEPPPSVGEDLAWMVTVGTSPQKDHLPLRIGSSVRVLRWGDLGLAAGLSANIKSWQDSGADLLLTYAPSIRGRQLGLSLGGGAHLPVAGSSRVLPTLTLNFTVY